MRSISNDLLLAHFELLTNRTISVYTIDEHGVEHRRAALERKTTPQAFSFVTRLGELITETTDDFASPASRTLTMITEIQDTMNKILNNCPYCHQPPGAPCVTRSGRPTSTHSARHTDVG